MAASEVSTSSLLCSHRFKKRWREEKGERRGGGRRGRREKGSGWREGDGGRGMEGGGREEERRWGLLTLCISVFSCYL